MNDLIYISMESAVIKYYDMAGSSYDPQRRMRNKHLTLLKHHYRPDLFHGKNGIELRKAKDGFLTQISHMVDVDFGL